MSLKHRSTITLPEISRADGEGTKNVFQQLMRSLFDNFKNIYDDLSGLTPGRSDTLPTASVDYLGKFYVKINAGAADTLHFCRYNGATLVYEWKQINLV